MKPVRLSYLVLMLGAGTQGAQSDIINADPALKAILPFDTSTAIENLKLCAPDLIGVDDLADIGYIYYDFVPPKGIYPKEGVALPLQVTRLVSMAIPKLSLASIQEKVATINQSSCEMEVKTSGVSARIDDIHHFSVQFHVEASARDCGEFFGIPYKIDKGDGRADVIARFVLSDQLQFIMEGKPILFNEDYNTNDFYSFVGLIFGFSLPASLAIGELLKEMALDDLEDKVNDALGDPGTQDVFKAFNSASASVERYTNSLDILPDLKLSLDFSRTGLILGKLSPPEIVITQTNKQIPAVYAELAYDLKKGEIAFINDLRNPRPRVHTVVEGDNLWKIAKAYGIDPYAYIRIEDLNGLAGKKLKIGQQVEIPLQAELCESVVVNDALVRPGDSVFGINRRKSFMPDPKLLRSGNVNLIYPYEQITLEP